MIHWRAFITLTIAVIVLRLAGFIGNVWTGFGIIALFAIWVVIGNLLPAYRRYALAVYAGWIICFLIIPALSGRVERSAPFTNEVLEQRSVWGDLITSESFKVSVLRDFVGFKRFADRMERSGGAWITQEYDRIYDSYHRGDMTRAQISERDRQLRAQILADKKWRDAASEFIQSQNSHSTLSLWDKAQKAINESEVAARFLLLAVFGIVAILIAALLPFYGRGLLAAAGILLLLVGLIASAILFINPGLLADIQKMPTLASAPAQKTGDQPPEKKQMAQKAKAPKAAAAKTTQVAQTRSESAEDITINLGPEWSRLVKIKRNRNFSFIHSPGTELKLEFDGTVHQLPKEFKDDDRFQEGARFRNVNGGKIIIRITPR